MDPVLNDDEKVELLKKWWGNYGNWITTAIIIVLVIIVSMQFWHRHEAKVAGQASLAYELMLNGVAKHDSATVAAQANTLMSTYSGTAYADVASLLLAKQSVEANKLEQAKQKLQWVIDHSNSAVFTELAKIRLARILVSQKQPVQALALLKGTGKIFPASSLSVKASALVAQGKTQQARKNYQAAIAALPKQSAVQPLLEMQMNDL